MRILLILVTLVSVIGTMEAGVEAQTDSPFIYHRVCDVRPGQITVARAIASDFTDLADSKNPDMQFAAFQDFLFPRNQVHFSAVFPDLAGVEAFRVAMATDPDYQAALRESLASLDGSTCTDTVYQVIP